MDNVLQTALAEAVNSLAGFFGTTTDAIMKHAPEFLAKYGWYSTLTNIPGVIFDSLLLTLLIVLICLLATLTIDGIEIRHPVLVSGGIFVLCAVILAGCKIIACAVAPEIVGVHAVLDLLNSIK